MKKTFALLPLLALGMLVSCNGGTGESSKPADSSYKTTDTTSTNTKGSEETNKNSSDPKVESIYEHKFIFNAPGNQYNAETKETGDENTLVSQSFTNNKHGGPNYALYINLLKEGNKVEAGRKTMYYTGVLANKDAFKTEGTWTVANGIYTINLNEFTYTVRGTGEKVNPATILTSTADGKVTWNYSGVKKNDAGEIVDNPYETTLNTQKSFAGEYQGTYKNQEGEVSPMDSMEVTENTDGTFKVVGAMEDSGISAFEGTVTANGVLDLKITRLDGKGTGYFYTDTDNKVKFHFDMEARERKSTCDGSLIA